MAATFLEKFSLNLLRILPKRHLSWLVGKCVYLRLPRPVVSFAIRVFSNRYGVNLAEASREVGDYPSLGDFFVRDLRDGAREIAEGFLAPVDGKITRIDEIRSGELQQIKGKSYSVETLLRDAERAKSFEAGLGLTFYLAPGDYHHIHSPCDGEVTEVVHIPGALWPVNTASVETIDGLFCTNERIIVNIKTATGTVAVVMVGATNVGSIRVPFSSLVANESPLLTSERRKLRSEAISPPKQIARGERVGTFSMGSTVVLLAQRDTFQLAQELQFGVIKFGTAIGEITK